MSDKNEMDIIFKPTSNLVARAITSTDAFLIELNPDAFFTWKSGIKAPTYTNCRRLHAYSDVYPTIINAMVSSIRASFPQVEGVGGMAEAGTVWSGTVAFQLGVQHSFMRKTIKKHGIKATIEALPAPGSKIVLIDDLVASGGTLLKTIQEYRSFGIEVIGVQSIVNWNFKKMHETFNSLNVPVKALVSYPDILQELSDSGRLSPAAAEEIKRFFSSSDPKSYQWNYNLLSSSEYKIG